MSYEPPLNDDVFDDEQYCDDCGGLMSDDTCGEPDVMYEEHFES